MNLHEYQSKQLFKAYGLPVSKGKLCYTPLEVEAAFDNLPSEIKVIKAQVHAGGRGKGGGVKIAKTASEAKKISEEMIGMMLITPQTSKEGKLVKKVYVEAGSDIDKELYLSLLMDRANKCISIVASIEGGMDIEEVAEKTPEAIVNVQINPAVGLQNFQILKVASIFKIDKNQTKQLSKILHGLYKVFIDKDLSMIEINPLIVTTDGDLLILDAKVSVDENALYKHPDIKALNDYEEHDQRDLQASKFGLSYVGLDGNIACMVNGAGLAMATMDIIKQYGAEPANFLDVGGGANKEKVMEAFKILLSDPNVKAILVNILGGIMKCDVIASGIIAAAKEMDIQVPLVVRLQGTNAKEGRELLDSSGINLVSASFMDEAAEKVVNLVKG